MIDRPGLNRPDPFRRGPSPAPGKTDIPQHSWIDVWLPPALRPYARLARLDRPIGWWLLLLPGLWALTMADFGRPNPHLAALFLVGAIIMRGAGCTYNDIVDRDIDTRVERTATRPLPSGEISLRGAWAFLAVQLAAGLAVLLQFNTPAIGVGAASLLLVASYPFMKRITYWPQAWLGLTFNWGVPLGWAAVRGGLDWSLLPLYGAGFFWTLGYDTIYAQQDKEDDVLVGVKSTALRLGGRSKAFIALMYLLAMGLIVVASCWVRLPAWPSLALLAVAALHLAWQVATLDINDAANCLRRFRSNRDFGLIVLFSMLLQSYFVA